MKKKLSGFTLAEVLVTLLVIGIVSAITIPALLSNVNDRALKSQKKALQVRLTNAIMNMPRIKGYGTVVKNSNGVITSDNAAEVFLIDGLSKVYKITNICGAGELKKCGIPDKYTGINGTPANFPQNKMTLANNSQYKYSNTSAAAFQTPNGESVAVFYDPDGCSSMPQGTTKINPHSRVCVNFVYDINGLEGPNAVGKDIGFITAVYRDEITVVAPEIYDKRLVSNSAPFYSNNDTDARALCIKENKKLRLPTLDEAIAIAANGQLTLAELIPDQVGFSFWTSTVYSSGNNGKAYFMKLHRNGTNDEVNNMNTENKAANLNVICVWE